MFTFIETPHFAKKVYDYLTDEEYGELQRLLNRYPETGKIVPGSGGLRKIRWAVAGRGKRGGVRVLYYLRQARDEIWLLTIYAKNVSENIPAHVLKRMKEEIDND